MAMAAVREPEAEPEPDNGREPTTSGESHNGLDPAVRDFYVRMLETLGGAGVPFLLGGAYAFARYTGIERHTKDIDVFVRPEDAERLLAVLGGAGCDIELTHPHWLGKAHCGDEFVDVIYSSGNGIVRVDDGWFAHAVPDRVLGVPVSMIPPEEMLWSKAFIMERERFDGADIAHLLRATASGLDWPRLVDRFGEHWRLLLVHLVLFGFVYPGERDRIPAWVVRELNGRLDAELDAPDADETLFRGTLISREQYLPDVQRWGYRDARLREEGGGMTGEQVADWTAAIERDGSKAN